MKTKKAFTLVELMIVIGIIAFLAVLIVAFLRTQVFKANDSKRKAEIKRIVIAVEEYEKDHDCYPATVTCTANTSLRPYLDTIPCDPVSKTSYSYEPETSTCPKWYRLYADLENEKDIDYQPNIGPSSIYSYYQSSPNAPTLVPNTNPSPSPTPPSGMDPFYGCFSGACQQINGTICTPNYGSPTCYGNCGSAISPQNECVLN